MAHQILLRYYNFDKCLLSQTFKYLSIRFKGISGKSQILFALVFVTRYLDLFTHYISLYNTLMKIFYLGSSLGTIYLMYKKFKATYDRVHDTFRVEFLIIPAILLAVLVNHEFEILEVWTTLAFN